MIRVLRLAVVPLMACTLAACAFGSGNSYVAPFGAPADADVLARDMADFVSGQLPAGSGTVVLEPTPSAQAGNPLTPVLVAALRDRGFAVTDTAEPGGPSAHRIRYLVTPIDNGDLLRVTIDGGNAEASRFFVRNRAGGLQAGGPFTVRQVAETQ